VDKNLLSGRSKMLWKEFAMLLGNDVTEGRDVNQLRDADRVYVMLKSHMRQLREKLMRGKLIRRKLGVPVKKQRSVERIEVGAAFQSLLAHLWKAYLPLQRALSEDNFSQATQEVVGFQKAYAAVNARSLPDLERAAWDQRKTTLLQLLDTMQAAPDLESLRVAFAPFSEEVGVFLKSFGSDQLGDVYELHCPMALDGQGAIWFQNQEPTKNPYYGSAMLECSDRVELIFPVAPQGSDMKAHEGHSHND